MIRNRLIVALLAIVYLWLLYLRISQVFWEDPWKDSVVECSIDMELFSSRYGYIYKSQKQPESAKRYFIAMNLKDNEEMMRNLIHKIIQLCEFLGTANVHVSIYENGSSDNTPKLLRLFIDMLNDISVKNTIIHDESVTFFTRENRIPLLSEIRNKAIAPMFNVSLGKFDKMIFINDVYFCLDDPVELLHQHIDQNADMTCAFDYGGKWGHSFDLFYDTWVYRELDGSVAFEGVNAKQSKWRYANGLPIQVFSCWNGMVVLNTEAFYNGLRFHAAKEGECPASECKILSQDLWELGYGIFF